MLAYPPASFLAWRCWWPQALLERWGGAEQHPLLDVVSVSDYSDKSLFVPASRWCDYQALLYTEGTSCAGRLPMMAMCDSLLLTTPPAYQASRRTHACRRTCPGPRGACMDDAA